MSEIWQRAQKVMPGGVNSPVRSYKAVGRDPIFIKSASGSKIYDIDGKEYIDYICGWGPMILGHNNSKIAKSITEAVKSGISFGAPTEIEVEMAECLVEMVPNVEMVRMVNSGTEAVMSALRLARGYTGKKKIIKFSGCYHGHSDSMLVSAGSGALTLSVPNSAGVTKGQAEDTLIADFNDIESVKALFEENKDDIAGVIIEPVAANMGVVLAKDGFLKELRNLCDKNNSLLIFDEVITGFRLSKGGAQEYFGVKADIVTFGKIIGAGLPVGAYAASKEIMSFVAPLGAVYQAGTLSGNPVAMAAGLIELKILRDSPEIYEKIDEMAKMLSSGLENTAKSLDLKVKVNRVGSLVCMFFTGDEVDSFEKAKSSDTKAYAEYFKKMLEFGIHLAPAQFEAMFVSYAHSKEDIEKTIECAGQAMKYLKDNGIYGK